MHSGVQKQLHAFLQQAQSLSVGWNYGYRYTFYIRNTAITNFNIIYVNPHMQKLGPRKSTHYIFSD